MDQLAWMLALKGNPLDWLLARDNPAVRYRTLTDVLEKPLDDPEVMQAKEAVWEYPPAKRLLEALEEPPRDLDTLFRFGLPRGHPALEKACQHWLKAEALPGPGCYTEQMIGGLIRYADLDDPRLGKKIRFVLSNQPFADGNRPGTRLRYGARGCCCGSHSCFSAVARALWALAGVPPDRRTAEIHAFLEKGASFLSAHRVYQRNHHGFKPVKGEWLNLHLPFALGWRTDVLDLLDVATQVGLADHPSIVDALRFLLSKQNDRGRWPLEQRYTNYKELLMTKVGDLETVGKESKWVTLAALTQLKRSEKLVARLCRGEEVEPPPVPPPQPRFAGYEFPYDASDEARVASEWESLRMRPVLEGLLAFAQERQLQVGWRWGFVMGPASCREWCAAAVRKVPAKNIGNAWPVCRIVFMANRGQFTAEGLSQRLGIPLRDEYPGQRKKGSWIDATLWRIGVEKWKDDYEEVGVTLRDPKESAGLREVMREALSSLAED